MRVEGVFGGDPRLEGGCSWLHVTSGRYEVSYPTGWKVEFEPLRLRNQEGQIVAGAADWLGVTGEEDGGTSHCQVGTGFAASSVDVLRDGPSMSQSTLVKLHRSGGFAGVSDWLIVEASGAATASSRFGGRQDSQVEEGQLAKLTSLVDAVDWAALATVKPGQGMPDGYTYRLYHGDHIVKVVDRPQPLAGPVRDLIGELSRLMG